MKVLVNYSHPLTEKGMAEIERIAGDEVKEVVIPTHIDMDGDVLGQLDALVDQAPADFDLLIPPALGVAAGYVTAKLSRTVDGAFPPVPPALVVVARRGFDGFVPITIVEA